MPNKKRASNRQNSVRVGNISDVSGNVNIAGGNITQRQTTAGLSMAEIKGLFDQLYARIDERPATPAAVKEDLNAEVKEIQSTVTEAVQENKKADETFLVRRFRNIARMAPDVLDVIVTTLANPLAGLGIAVKKVAEKAKEEVQK